MRGFLAASALLIGPLVPNSAALAHQKTSPAVSTPCNINGLSQGTASQQSRSLIIGRSLLESGNASLVDEARRLIERGLEEQYVLDREATQRQHEYELECARRSREQTAREPTPSRKD